MAVHENSIAAYHASKEQCATKREIILNTVKEAYHPSSADIVRLTGIRRESVTGRLKELEKEGLIRKSDEKKIDPFTKMKVNYYLVVE